MSVPDYLYRKAVHLENVLSHVRGSRTRNAYVPGTYVRHFDTARGPFFLPENAADDVIARSIRKGRLYDAEVVHAAQQYVGRDSTVLDVGANYGQMSIEFSRMVGEGGRVYAFEAHPEVFGVLTMNIAANRAANISPIHAAVYDRSGVQLHYSEPDATEQMTRGSHGLDPRSDAGQTVRSLTIDDANIEGRIHFIKIDIQGCDLFALRGARNAILKMRMPIIFEYEEGLQPRFGTCFQDYVDFVQSIHYRFQSTIQGTNFLIVPK